MNNHQHNAFLFFLQKIVQRYLTVVATGQHCCDDAKHLFTSSNKSGRQKLKIHV